MKSEATAEFLRTKVEIRRIEVIPIRVNLTFKRTLSKGAVSLGKVGSGVGASDQGGERRGSGGVRAGTAADTLAGRDDRQHRVRDPRLLRARADQVGRR
jgi:hypothetical protein